MSPGRGSRIAATLFIALLGLAGAGADTGAGEGLRDFGAEWYVVAPSGRTIDEG